MYRVAVLIQENISFCRRVESAWNSLSGVDDDFRTLPCFKRLVQRSDLSQFLNYK
jgi:hypothetical protein